MCEQVVDMDGLKALHSVTGFEGGAAGSKKRSHFRSPVIVPVGCRNDAALLKEGASGDGITDIGDHDNLRNTGMVGETVLPRKILPEIDRIILFPSLQVLIYIFGFALTWLYKCNSTTLKTMHY